jgi:hypothetical protein
MLPPNSSCDYDLRRNGTDMVSELALFEDKILGIRVKV